MIEQCAHYVFASFFYFLYAIEGYGTENAASAKIHCNPTKKIIGCLKHKFNSVFTYLYFMMIQFPIRI